MPADGASMSGQTARITMFNMLQAMGDGKGNLNINIGQIAHAHGQIVESFASEMQRQATAKEQYLDILRQLKEGKLQLNRLVITDDGVQIKEAQRPSQRKETKSVAPEPVEQIVEGVLAGAEHHGN